MGQIRYDLSPRKRSGNVYVISDIHGAYDEFMELLNHVEFNESDDLYIIGDIFDGNSSNPQACLDLLFYAEDNSNVNLIRGNHEDAYLQYFKSCFNKDMRNAECWYNVISNSDFGGKALLELILKQDEKSIEKIYNILSDLKVSDLVKISENMYLYLVHGCPVERYKNVGDLEEEMLWKFITDIDRNIDMYQAVFNDPFLDKYGMKYYDMKRKINRDNIFTIVGHTPTRYILSNDTNEIHQQTIVYNNKIKVFSIDCGCRSNSLNRQYSNSNWVSDLALLKFHDGCEPEVFYYSSIIKN